MIACVGGCMDGAEVPVSWLDSAGLRKFLYVKLQKLFKDEPVWLFWDWEDNEDWAEAEVFYALKDDRLIFQWYRNLKS